MIPLAEDFESIAAELKRIEAEKKPIPTSVDMTVRLIPHEHVEADLTYAGWLAPYNTGLDGPDYDPA